MPNVATVSFKISPEHYTVLKAMAQNGYDSVSELCRETLVEALDLDGKVNEMASFFASPTRKTESAQPLSESVP